MLYTKTDIQLHAHLRYVGMQSIFGLIRQPQPVFGNEGDEKRKGGERKRERDDDDNDDERKTATPISIVFLPIFAFRMDSKR